jgi:hypothetical protein
MVTRAMVMCAVVMRTLTYAMVTFAQDVFPKTLMRPF